mgnify:FL=1|jgi:phage baseplate assembly protein W
MAIFNGFSSRIRKNKFGLSDFDLVKQDLTNHFNIRRGEMLMHPNFGVGVWNLLFEPFTSEIKEAVMDDIRQVIDNDPRVSLTQMVVQEYEHGIQVAVDIFYVNLDSSDTLSLQFDRTEGLLT